jgi:hypothetical protein
MSYQLIPNLTYLGHPVYYNTTSSRSGLPPSLRLEEDARRSKILRDLEDSSIKRDHGYSWSTADLGGGNKRKSYRRKSISRKKKSRKSRK